MPGPEVTGCTGGEDDRSRRRLELDVAAFGPGNLPAGSNRRFLKLPKLPTTDRHNLISADLRLLVW
jgi:hypothetical protein